MLGSNYGVNYKQLGVIINMDARFDKTAKYNTLDTAGAQF